MWKPKPREWARTLSPRGRARGALLAAGAAAVALAVVSFALTGPDHSSAVAAPVAATKSNTGGDDATTARASASADPTAPEAGAGAGSDKPAGTAPSASPSPSQTVDPSRRLSQAVASLVSADDGHVSVAVEDLTTGTTVSDNVGDEYVTASIVKLDILETLLYQDQRNGSSPSPAEAEQITAMIENSDNDAALDLYDEEGGASAITAADKVFGLTGTVVDDAAFGDTTTTVTDQIALLRQALTPDSVLTAANRGYIRKLMSKVESDQRWGVSAAADDPSSSAGDYLLKNGWLPRSATNLWEINSIGEVEHDGGEYLVAVLSDDNGSMDSGIDVVQNVAKAAVDSQGGAS
jgi:hypothetical protein